MSDWKDIRNWSREEMMKRVARFRGLKGSDGGLPDSPLPECRRKLYAVIGFQPPMTDNAATTSPVGADASAMPAIAIAEGFNLGYCKAKPGKGPLMHNHDTNETFIPITGKWRCEWNEGEAMEHVDLEPLIASRSTCSIASPSFHSQRHLPVIGMKVSLVSWLCMSGPLPGFALQ